MQETDTFQDKKNINTYTVICRRNGNRFAVNDGKYSV